MLIYRVPEPGYGVRYYKHTNNGRPIFSGKCEATDLLGTQLEQVLRHLKIMQPAREFGTMGRGDRYKAKKRAAAE